jgi:hypothetical protein
VQALGRGDDGSGSSQVGQPTALSEATGPVDRARS